MASELDQPHSIRVNGREILHVTRAITFNARTDSVPVATIEVYNCELEFDGYAKLEVNTRDGIEERTLNDLVKWRLGRPDTQAERETHERRQRCGVLP